MSNIFENKGAMAATIVVAASNSLNKGAANYVCDGTADDVEIQAAINALPATGGCVLLLDGTYTLTAQISRAIDDIEIRGCGHATLLNWNNTNPVITAGARDGWLFSNFSTDAGGVSITTATQSAIRNVWIAGVRTDNPGGGITPATLVVAAVDSKYPARADYQCDGAADEVQINLALAALPAAGGKVVLLEGNYVTAANITVPINATLEGQGKATIITPTGAAITNGIVLSGDNAVLKDMKVVVAAGAGVPGSRPNVVYATGRTLLRFDNLWIYGDITVNDGVDARQNGIFLDTCTYSRITGCCVENNIRSGIRVASCSYITVEGSIFRGNHDVGAVFYTSSYCTIVGNTGQGNTSQGVELINGSNNNTVVGNTFIANTNQGINVSQGGGAASSYNTITGNTCRGSTDGIRITSPYNVITGNDCQANTATGILIYRTSYNIVSGNVCRGTTGGDGINVFGDATGTSVKNSIIGNTCSGNSDDGIGIDGGTNAVQNVLIGNVAWENTHAQIEDNGSVTVLYEIHCDLYMDVVAITADYIRSNQALSGATPLTFTIDNQPDVPRTLSGHFDSHANITAYRIEITGTNARGQTHMEAKSEGSGWDWETNSAFATITSIIMTTRTGTGVGDTMDIGVTDVLGLSHKIYQTSDVFKIKKNNANALVAAAQVSTNPCTYDMTVIGLAVGDDFTIWVRSALNPNSP